jgi:hypothetical protein
VLAMDVADALGWAVRISHRTQERLDALDR